MFKGITKSGLVWLSLAIAFLMPFCYSCGGKAYPPTIEDPESTPTMVSRNLTSVESQNGVRKYRFETPLVEEYGEASEPFREFREGIKLESFAEDSVTVELDIIADYAHHNMEQGLWRAEGNVVARNLTEDRTLYTEQLFWDEKRKIIYSNVFTRVFDKEDVHVGTNFEADQDFTWFTLSTPRGVKTVDSIDNSSRGQRDSITVDENGDTVRVPIQGDVKKDTLNGTDSEGKELVRFKAKEVILDEKDEKESEPKED